MSLFTAIYDMCISHNIACKTNRSGGVDMSHEQFDKTFVPFLSVIDAMMFCDPIEINNMLDNILIV